MRDAEKDKMRRKKKMMWKAEQERISGLRLKCGSQSMTTRNEESDKWKNARARKRQEGIKENDGESEREKIVWRQILLKADDPRKFHRIVGRCRPDFSVLAGG